MTASEPTASVDTDTLKGTPMSTDPRSDAPEPTDPLDQLEPETVEDLDADAEADDIAGGTGNAWTALCNGN